MNEVAILFGIIAAILFIGLMFMKPDSDYEETEDLKYYRNNFLSARAWRNTFGRW